MGFYDLNLINRQWKLNHDSEKHLDVLARILLNNSQKMSRTFSSIREKKSRINKRMNANLKPELLKRNDFFINKKLKGGNCKIQNKLKKKLI